MFGLDNLFKKQEEVSEVVYQGGVLNVPEALKAKGWGEKFSVKVIKNGEEYLVDVEADFKEGVDSLDLLPTTQVCATEAEALNKAKEAEANLEVWDASHI